MSNHDLTTAPQDRSPAWYRGYLALAVTNVVTFGLALWLGYEESRQFERAVTVHRGYSEVLERLADVRAQVAVVNAPGNNVFMTNNAVDERQALDDALIEFRKRYEALKKALIDNMDERTSMMVTSYFPKIEQELNFTASDARQIFYFMALGNMREAGAHMASMDEHTALLGTAFLEVEHVIRGEQLSLLDSQQTEGLTIRTYGLVLAVLVVVVVMAAALHGRRVRTAIRAENIERERYQQSLREAREQAEHATRIKSQFLANMSHEIRTPMNGVLGMLEALSITKLSQEQSGMLKTANASADILLAIIDDILDFSKIEAGMLVIERVPVDIGAVVQRVVSLYNVRASDKMLTLDYQVSADVPNSVIGDPTRLTQLLSNFVSNAIKFTANGRVTICVEVQKVDALEVMMRFSVKDTGIGISPDAQKKLFTAFTQADNSTSRRFGGTGLGLAICKQLVTLLDPEHGDIGVRSEPGQGSEFYFALRMQVAAKSATVSESSTNEEVPSAFIGKVLVAEDNDTNQQVAITMLRNVGVEAVLASDGQLAVEAARGDTFDLILMDYHMPQLDGCEATRQIRDYEKLHSLPRVPIVALTASVLSEDRERCLSAGMDDVLAKPMRQAMLCRVLAQWLTARDAGEKPATADEPQWVHADSELPDELFDAAQLKEMREVTGDAFVGLVRQFHGNVAQGVHAIRSAIEAKSADDLRKHAHKLKGGAATIGVKEVARISQQLEMLGKSETVDGGFALLDQLVQTYLRAKPLLDEFAGDASESIRTSA